MTAQLIESLGTAGEIFVDGPLARNPLFAQVVRRLRSGGHGAHLPGRRRHARRRASGRPAVAAKPERIAQRGAAAYPRAARIPGQLAASTGGTCMSSDRCAARSLLAARGHFDSDCRRRCGADYRNPILYADYSDPDVIRSRGQPLSTDGGSSFHLLARSAAASRSADLRALANRRSRAGPRCLSTQKYDLPGPLGFSDGSERARFFPRWAIATARACGRHRFGDHNGRFYIYFATPTEGIFMVSARGNQRRPWTAPVRGDRRAASLEDPCPFWDRRRAKAYLVHSRVRRGATDPASHERPTARRCSTPARSIVDDPANLPHALEGPKLLKRNGWYYIFAPIRRRWRERPAGRDALASSIWGPYEVAHGAARRASSTVQAPHQGGYVETPERRGLVPALQQHRRVRPHRCTCSRCAGWTLLRHDGAAESSSRGRPPPVMAGDVRTPCPNVGKAYAAGIPPGLRHGSMATQLGVQWGGIATRWMPAWSLTVMNQEFHCASGAMRSQLDLLAAPITMTPGAAWAGDATSPVRLERF